MAILIVWTSLGLNQGPPDYESVAKLAEFFKFSECNQLSYKSINALCQP